MFAGASIGCVDLSLTVSLSLSHKVLAICLTPARAERSEQLLVQAAEDFAVMLKEATLKENAPTGQI